MNKKRLLTVMGVSKKPWYRAGGAPVPVAVYQPHGAVNLAASYINKINPGVHNLSVGSVPDWSASSGWEFLGSGDWLISDITPVSGYSMIVKYSDAAGNGILAGSFKAGAYFALWPYQIANDAAQFGSGGILAINSAKNISGTMAVAGNKGYIDGSVVAGTIGAWSDTSLPIYIGGANDGDGTPTSRMSSCFIQAVAIYDKTLTVAQVKGIHDRVVSETNFTMVVYDGDSITLGLSGGAGGDYPTQCTNLLGVNKYAKRNIGVGGQTWADILADAETDTDKWFNSERTNNICVCMSGFNDLNGTGLAAADIYATISSYISGRQAAGFKVVVNTVLKSTGLTGDEETQRQELNTLIISNAASANKVADVASATELSDPSDATYFTDGTHLTAAGYAVVARVVSAEINDI